MLSFFKIRFLKTHLFQLFGSIIFKKNCPKRTRFCKIGLRNTLFIFGRNMSFVLFVAILCPILAYCFLIVALRELRSLCCHVPKLRIMGRFRTVGISRFQFWLILQICKDAIELLDSLRSVSDKLFFQNEVKRCFIRWFWFQTILIILEGFTAPWTWKI